jgi:hypothetical protein
MADVKYPKDMPVDEPVVKPKPKLKPPVYPDSVPVDEPVKKMASGGSASSRADGCAERGKTKGTMVMCGGGMARKK